MKLDIGDLVIQVATNHDEVTTFCQERYGAFVSRKDHEFTLEVEFLDNVEPTDYLEITESDLEAFYNPELRKKLSDDGKSSSRPVIIDCSDRILIYRSDFIGIVQPEKNRGKVLVKENQITMGLDSFLRICYSFIILNYQGLVLHSAGIVKDENGYVFFGVSETGKSTISGLSQEFSTILSDEIIIIRKNNGVFDVYGSPFYGTLNYHAVNMHRPVKAAFMPVKDTSTYLTQAHPITFLSKFLAAVLFFGKEPELIEKVLAVAHDFMDSVPFYEMHFELKNTFWEHIEEAKNKKKTTENTEEKNKKKDKTIV